MQRGARACTALRSRGVAGPGFRAFALGTQPAQRRRMYTRLSWFVVSALLAACSDAPSPVPAAPDGGERFTDASTSDASVDALAPSDAEATKEARAEVDGIVSGAPFQARGVAAKRFGWLRDGGAPGPGVSLAIGEYASMCGSARPDLGRVLHFYLRGEGTSTLPTGRITIVAGSVLGGGGAAPEGTVMAARLSGSDCGFASVDDQATGTVEITRSDARGVAGTFELTFAKSGAVRGSFDAPYCAGGADTTIACVL